MYVRDVTSICKIYKIFLCGCSHETFFVQVSGHGSGSGSGIHMGDSNPGILVVNSLLCRYIHTYIYCATSLCIVSNYIIYSVFNNIALIMRMTTNYSFNITSFNLMNEDFE